MIGVGVLVLGFKGRVTRSVWGQKYSVGGPGLARPSLIALGLLLIAVGIATALTTG